MAELRLMVRMFRYVVPILLALYLYMLARSESQARALIRKELRKNLRSCHMCTLQLYPSAKLYSLQYMHSPEFVLIKNDHIICIYKIQCDHALLCPSLIVILRLKSQDGMHCMRNVSQVVSIFKTNEIYPSILSSCCKTSFSPQVCRCNSCRRTFKKRIYKNNTHSPLCVMLGKNSSVFDIIKTESGNCAAMKTSSIHCAMRSFTENILTRKSFIFARQMSTLNWVSCICHNVFIIWLFKILHSDWLKSGP